MNADLVTDFRAKDRSTLRDYSRPIPLITDCRT